MTHSAATVLILEDQPLIVMDLEDTLVAQGGLDVVGTLSSCEAAIDWLKTQRPDVVVLDIELRDGHCTQVAKTLVERRIPFVVHSGSMPNSTELDPIFQRGAWVLKPSSETELLAAVRDAALTSRRAFSTASPVAVAVA